MKVRVRVWVWSAVLLLWVAGGTRNATAEAGDWWAYRPIRMPEPPGADAGSGRWRSDRVLDRFVEAGWEAAGVVPAGEADRADLCRRLALDLTGLPASTEEIDSFLADARPDAWERLVERYLSSPRFGEHWARHWFDVVRFAESVTLRGFVFREAWRYRDHVIDAFNEDRPVDRFLREQIAGDLLPAADPEERRRQVVATTFLMMGNTNLEEQDKKQLEMDVVDEQMDVIGKAFLGQTLSCARCHDHKFDPVPIRDYYAMAGILKNSLAIRHDNVSAWVERPLPLEAELEEAYARLEAELGKLRAELGALAKDAVDARKALESRMREVQVSLPPRPMVMAPREAESPADIAVHLRGSVHRPGEVVPRGFLGVATPPGQGMPGAGESGRRELAEWIVAPGNPLTRRVFVNRVWHWLMGRGLVRTPDNFGTTGEVPTHPELLDALAAAFGGDAEAAGVFPGLRAWSLKSLVREIVLSRTYRLSVEGGERLVAVDPENRLLARAHARRLTAEQMRDRMLVVSGRLRLEPPRGPTFPNDRSADFGFVDQAPHRSVYVPVFRNALPELFEVFDFPPASLVTGERSESTVATQALYLMNSPFVREQAEAAARRLMEAMERERRRRGFDAGVAGVAGDAGIEARRVVDLACRWTLGRGAGTGEVRAVVDHLAAVGDTAAGWADVFQAWMASADFRHVP